LEIWNQRLEVQMCVDLGLSAQRWGAAQSAAHHAAHGILGHPVLQNDFKGLYGFQKLLWLTSSPPFWHNKATPKHLFCLANPLFY
jgi:hypothetical protein